MMNDQLYEEYLDISGSGLQVNPTMFPKTYSDSIRQ